MSWKNNKPSPEERPLHYIGKRHLHEVIAFSHIEKIVIRHNPELIEEGVAYEVSLFYCHIWSSNTFTVVFMETGHMGVSKRNLLDVATLGRGMRIAAGRALTAFMATWLHEEKLLEEGGKGEDLRDQIIPMARKNVPHLLKKIELDECIERFRY